MLGARNPPLIIHDEIWFHNPVLLHFYPHILAACYTFKRATVFYKIIGTIVKKDASNCIDLLETLPDLVLSGRCTS